jgi:hypothetical protein
MSSTTSLHVAVQYSLPQHRHDAALSHQAAAPPSSLIFKLHTSSFMERAATAHKVPSLPLHSVPTDRGGLCALQERGCSLAFLSAFPAENEILFPPLTYLRPTGKTEVLSVERILFTVVELVPVFGS